MYRIVYKEAVNVYYCYLRYQDGTEEWTENDLSVAIENMIRSAYAWNGSRISSKDIDISAETIVFPTPKYASREEEILVESIKSGKKIVLDHDDFRLKANLTNEEVEMIFGIREGRLKVVHGRD